MKKWTAIAKVVKATGKVTDGPRTTPLGWFGTPKAPKSIVK